MQQLQDLVVGLASALTPWGTLASVAVNVVAAGTLLWGGVGYVRRRRAARAGPKESTTLQQVRNVFGRPETRNDNSGRNDQNEIIYDRCVRYVRRRFDALDSVSSSRYRYQIAIGEDLPPTSWWWFLAKMAIVPALVMKIFGWAPKSHKSRLGELSVLEYDFNTNCTKDNSQREVLVEGEDYLPGERVKFLAVGLSAAAVVANREKAEAKEKANRLREMRQAKARIGITGDPLA